MVRSEGDARALGRFIYHKRIMAFLKLKRRLVEDAQADMATLKEAAAQDAAAAAAAQAPRSAGAAAGPARSPTSTSLHSNDFSGVADMLGLAELFGGEADAPAGEAAPAGAAPAVPARPMLSAGGAAADGMHLGVWGSAPGALGGSGSGGGGGPAARRPLFGSGGSEAVGGGSDSRRQLAAGGRKGFGKEDLRAFLEARGAGECAVLCICRGRKSPLCPLVCPLAAQAVWRALHTAAATKCSSL